MASDLLKASFKYLNLQTRSTSFMGMITRSYVYSKLAAADKTHKILKALNDLEGNNDELARIYYWVWGQNRKLDLKMFVLDEDCDKNIRMVNVLLFSTDSHLSECIREGQVTES